MLAFMLGRLDGLRANHLVVATTDHPCDDPVAEVATSAGAAVVRGDETDVLGRFMLTLRSHPADVVVRLTADCPLIDTELIEAAIDLHRLSEADYTSNTIVRTYPDGLDVEVVTSEAMIAAADSVDSVEREHVTPYVYRHPERFHLAALRQDRLLGDERWTVDTLEDLDRVRSIVAQLRHHRVGWLDILEVTGVRPIDPDRLRLVPALDATPAIRTWDAKIGAATVGRVAMTVTAGRGDLSVFVEPEWHEAALAVLRQTLRADYQITDLVEVRRPHN
jgi:spore coat polysaccharide biosynthesis protein SpsF